MRPRAPTTREIPIAVDATLPAITAALERLRASLGRNGTAAQLLAVESIATAVDAIRIELRVATVAPSEDPLAIFFGKNCV